MRGLGFTIALFLLIFCGLTGCSAVMLTSKLPDGYTVKELAKVDRQTPFAVGSGGTYAVIVDKELKLIQGSGPARRISAEAPTVMRFSPAGTKLAAATPVQGKSVLRLFDLEGKVVGETNLPARLTSLAWRSEGELFATGVSIRKFSFGSSLTTFLYVWDGVNSPKTTTIGDVTLRPAVANLPEESLYRSHNISISPYGDEIAFSTVKDPPLFTPYVEVLTRHLETGTQHKVGVTSIGSGGPVYTPDGESVLVGDTQAMARRLALPDGKDINAWPAQGSYPAISPSGQYLFMDGRLYDGGNEVAWFPYQARGAFLPDGSGVAISYDDKLYLLSGINDRPAPPLGDIPALLELRKLRALEKISEKEYRARKQKLLRAKEQAARP